MSNKILTNDYFFSPTKGHLTFEGVIKEIFDYMKLEPEHCYEVIVGCDSPSSKNPFFPIAIVVLRKGSGGRFFLKKMKYDEKISRGLSFWKNRILQEVYLSCELALSLKEVLVKENKYGLKYNFQYIHADVGENGQTREMVKEIIGLIRSNGFEARIKPQSFVASVVADRYT